MKSVYYVGIDVDDKAFHGHIVTPNKETIPFVTRPSAAALVARIKELLKSKNLGDDIRVCYEAGYLGFSLQRELREKGLACEVIAPGLIPIVPGRSSRKTDRLDSLKLAEFYAAGMLVFVTELATR